MAKRSGAYKSEKRKKELTRNKKQDEKRKKRLQKNPDSEPEPASDNSSHADDEKISAK